MLKVIHYTFYNLKTPISRNISYLVAASESIVSNILITKKTKIIFSISQKHVAKIRNFYMKI